MADGFRRTESADHVVQFVLDSEFWTHMLTVFKRDGEVMLADVSKEDGSTGSVSGIPIDALATALNEAQSLRSTTPAASAAGGPND